MDVVSSDELIYSEAFKVLDELVDSNELSCDRADEAKRIYQDLHTAALKAMASEKQRLDEAKVLKKRLEDENEARNPLPAQGEESDLQAALQVLREDEEAARAEVTIAQEKVHLLEAEVGELTQRRDDAQQQYDAEREQHRLGLLPQIQQLQEEINVAQSDSESKQKKIEKYSSDMEALEAKIAAADENLSGLSQLKSQCDTELHKAQQLPEKAARQSRTVETLNTQLESKHNRLQAKCEASDALIAKCQEEQENLETEHATAMVEVERGEYATEAQERSVGEVQKQFHLKQFEAEQILAKQAELTVQDRMKQSEVLRAQEELSSVTKEKDRLVKRVKKLENVLKVIQATCPSLEAQKEQQQHNCRRAEDSVRKLQEEVKEQRAQVDLHMMLYLQEEGSGKEKNAMFIASHEHIVELERSIGEYRKAEQASLRALHEASAARDRASMQQATQVKKLKECKKEGMLKEMVGRDLKKMRRSIMSRVRDFQQLYDLVKNQRNRFVNLIQAARQGICEMKEKLRITMNELEILRTEFAKKEQLLSQRRSEKQRAVSKTMALRTKLNKLGVVMRERQNKVDEQIAEIDKHNAIINTTEKEMIRLRKQYEVIVELRNYTGVMVIDRNDELCVMYERKSVQETVQKQGDYALAKLEDQIRVLKIDVTDVSCSIEATKKKCPEVPKLDKEIATLQRDILMTKQEGRELEQQLEDPSNPSRWRMLHGRIKDKDELRIKVNQLEERLNHKKEQLLERDLILEEVTNLSNALRLQAMAGRAGTLEIARKSNAYQGQLRNTTRKMMATISELSMYQATVMKLTAEKDSVAEEVHRARLKLADGEAPTEDAEKEWRSIVRGEEVAEIMQEKAAERMRLLEARGNVSTTTAEPRPRAYIPEELGIPKPYGNFEPFKPAEPGATMRHIRKPEIQPVVI